MLGNKKIVRLDTQSRHQLEAEQVIVDLSSALKELVENALDAQASSIDILLVNYGLDKIIVTDDGAGISAEDMNSIASNRYATSKIESDADLETSENYGFRGEALHSLVTLSESVIISSCRDESTAGLCKTFSSFGKYCEIVSRPRPKGTTIAIEGLFSAITVRKLDWLKRKAQIMGQAVFLIQSYAVMSTGTKFVLRHLNDSGSTTRIFSSRGLGPKQNYSDCFGTSSQLCETFSEEFTVHNSVCLLDGLYVKNKKEKSKSRLVIFINQKPFDSPKWQRSMLQMLKKNYSIGVEFFIQLTVPMLWLDFNVSPDKRSIYLLNESAILEHFLKQCENVLQQTTQSSIQTIHPTTVLTPKSTQPSVKEESSCTDCCYDPKLLSIGSAESVQLGKDDISKLVPIGQFNNGFIVCSKLHDSGVNELFAVDQHAADERIRYEEISRKYSITLQSLVAPVPLSLSPEQEEVLERNSSIIASAGFTVKRTNDSYFLVSIPSFHGIECDSNDFYDLIEHVKDHGLLYRNLCPKFQRVLAYKACRSAVMIGSPLTLQQMQTILDRLSVTDYPWICAHGRPTVQFLKRLSNEPSE